MQNPSNSRTQLAMLALREFISSRARSAILVSIGSFFLLCLPAFSSPAKEGVPDELAPDLIVVNAKVVTLDNADRIVEAVAIKGDRILATGATDAIRKLAGSRTQVFDAGGRVVLPGFVDAHSHTTGVPPDYLDLYGARSIAEIVEAVSKKAKTQPPGEWIVGSGTFMIYSGWDDQRLEDKRWVTRWDLDPVSPQNPVLLIKDGGHAVVLNSYALRLAGITRETSDPKGHIARDAKTGEATGAILKLASEVLSELLPAPTLQERIEAAANASAQLLQMGTTTVGDAATDAEAIRVFQAMYGSGDDGLVSTVLNPVVPAAQGAERAVEFVKRWQVTTGFGDGRLKLGALKIFVDGGVTSRTAWFKTPYKDRPGYYGIAEVDGKTLLETVRVADELGWQLHFHTCGDAAVESVLDALEAAKKENRSSGRRHLLTHLYVLSSEQIARLRRLEVVAVLQPNFVYSLGEHMRAVLSEEQLAHLIPFRTLLEAGIPVALSADGHPQEPLYGVFAAVVRKTSTGHLLGAGEAVSVKQALKAYTRTSAYALFEEEERGSLEAGKVADLIVLDRDILSVPPEQIKDIQVLVTIKSGKIVVNRLEQGQSREPVGGQGTCEWREVAGSRGMMFVTY